MRRACLLRRSSSLSECPRTYDPADRESSRTVFISSRADDHRKHLKARFSSLTPSLPHRSSLRLEADDLPELRGIVEAPRFDDGRDTAQGSDVGERIALDDDQIRALAGLDRAGLLVALH